jgi:hypothetical protein
LIQGHTCSIWIITCTTEPNISMSQIRCHTIDLSSNVHAVQLDTKNGWSKKTHVPWE